MNAQLGGGVEPPDDGNLALRMGRVEDGLASVSAELGSVKSELGSVKSQLGSVQSELGSVKAELVSVKTDVAIIKSNYATKEDLHREIGAQTWRLVTFVCAFGTVLVSATYFVARLAMVA